MLRGCRPSRPQNCHGLASLDLPSETVDVVDDHHRLKAPRLQTAEIERNEVLSGSTERDQFTLGLVWGVRIGREHRSATHMVPAVVKHVRTFSIAAKTTRNVLGTGRVESRLHALACSRVPTLAGDRPTPYVSGHMNLRPSLSTNMHELTAREPAPPPLTEQLVDVTPTAKPPVGVDEAAGARGEEAAAPHLAIVIAKATTATTAPTVRPVRRTARGIRERRSTE